MKIKIKHLKYENQIRKNEINMKKKRIFENKYESKKQLKKQK